MPRTLPSAMAETRFICHIDMDAFYTSVEQRDQPELRGQAVIVGADPAGGHGRGVVAACSYEARSFGVKSGLPISRAFRLCPSAIFLRPDFQKYRKVSGELRRIFGRYSDRIEPLSIDEAFLDLTDRVQSVSSARHLAVQIKNEIRRQERLTASIGIGPSKLVAKIASDLEKPDGLVLVSQHRVQDFLDPLSVSRIWGIGPKTEEKLRQQGITHIRDLRAKPRQTLRERFGKSGGQLWDLANGIDERGVVARPRARSSSQERTFAQDTSDSATIVGTVQRLCQNLWESLQARELEARTITLKLRYSDFTTITRQRTIVSPLSGQSELFEIASSLLVRHRNPKRKVRLIGVSVSSFRAANEEKQLRLF